MKRFSRELALATIGVVIGVTLIIIGIFASQSTFTTQSERLDCNTSIVPVYLRNGDKAEYYISNLTAIQDPLLIEILDSNGKSIRPSHVMNTTSNNVIQNTIDSNNTGFYSINVKFSTSQCDQAENNHLILSLVIYQNPNPLTHSLTIGIAIITGIAGYFVYLIRQYLLRRNHRLSN
jgi:hypothetical protein